MLQSNLFTKTERNAPKDDTALNAQLLTRGGFIHKVMAGVYEYLPLGWRVIRKIEDIIREEMNSTGAEELHMSILQNKETWSATGRWTIAADVMYQFKDASDHEVGLGWTHEEPLTVVAKKYINSYKDLPKAVYQIQVKFRNEPRAKSGVLRGREFIMKDLYSFHTSEPDLNLYYEKVAAAYERAFHRIGLDARRTVASGGLFSKFSDEFQVIADVGEDTIFYCTRCSYTANKDVANDLKLTDKCPQCAAELKQGRGIEVGNIFKLGTKYSEALGLTFTDEKGEKKPVIMASYGIGVSRLMGTIIEVSHDDRGMIWPENVAPFKVHLLELNGADASEIYKDLQAAGVEVLYDERKAGAGEKLTDADLLGIPYRAVVSPQTGDKIELKKRNESEVKLIAKDKFVKLFSK